MMKTLAAFLMIFGGCMTVYGQNQKNVTLHGSVQSDVLLPKEDTDIGADKTGDLLTNTYVDLQLQSQYVDAGVRMEYLERDSFCVPTRNVRWVSIIRCWAPDWC